MIETGCPAPEFTLRDQHGQEQSLITRRGSRNVLLMFFPFAFTGVCTGELRALDDRAADWTARDTDVLAVSCDFAATLRAFADAEGVTVPLLSDFWPHGAVATAYDVFNSRIGAAERASFVIDRTGAIRWTVQTAMDEARKVEDYVTALDRISAV